MGQKKILSSLALLLTGSIVPYVAHCEVYLTEPQVLKTLFPGEAFEKKSISLSPADIQKIEKASGQNVRVPSVVAYVSKTKNVIFIDQVVGKHEFITYAVAVTPEGKVKGVEIMEYRESYGQQVKENSWRKQFVGKDIHSPLKVGSDITNISGATLSSSHVTAGVKRILQTYDCIQTRL